MNSKSIEVLPAQAALIECEAKMCAGYGGIGSGKTYAACWKMLRFMQRYPKAAPYVCGADFEQLRTGYFLSFKNILDDSLNWEEGRDYLYRDSPRPTLILVESGARLRALSSEIAERIRSTEIQFLHMEEPQTWHDGEQVFRTLIGRMRHSVRSAKNYPALKPQAVLTFNPPLVGTWLHKLITETWAKEGYPSWRMSLRDNYLMPDLEGYIRLQEANLPPHLWPVEIDGQFGTTGGEVYRSYDGLKHGLPGPGMPPIALDPAKPLMWSLDFNVGLMCSVVAQTHWNPTLPIVRLAQGYPNPGSRYAWPGYQRRVVYIIGEIVMADSGAEDVVKEFIRLYGAHAKAQGVFLYGDAAGGARSQVMSSLSANRTPLEAIINALRAEGIPVTLRIQRANPPVLDRINLHNAQLLSGEGIGMLVHAQCERLIADYREVRRKPGENDIDKSDKSPEGLKRTHMSDAAGYMVWVERKLEKQPNSINWSLGRW